MDEIFHRHRHDPVDINITITGLGELLQNEKKILEFLHLINTKIDHMAQELDDLKAAVAKDTEVDSSAITLLNGLKTKLDAAIASGDPAALTALSTQLGSNAQGLADAVTANTPAEG